MNLGDLLRKTLDVDCEGAWENERTPTLVRVFRVHLHSMGLSLRKIVAVFNWLGVDRLHEAVWNWQQKEWLIVGIEGVYTIAYLIMIDEFT